MVSRVSVSSVSLDVEEDVVSEVSIGGHVTTTALMVLEDIFMMEDGNLLQK